MSIEFKLSSFCEGEAHASPLCLIFALDVIEFKLSSFCKVRHMPHPFVFDFCS